MDFLNDNFGNSDPIRLANQYAFMSEKECNVEFKLYPDVALDDQLLHTSIFARADGQNHKKQASRMERYTHRRRNRR